MIKENLNIGDRVCTVYSVDNAKVLLIQPVDDHDIEMLDSEVSYIEENAGKSFILAAFKINDWNNELSPWQAPAVFGKNGFGGGAGKTLEYVENALVPQIIEKYGLAEDIPIIIGGYSLAALFSLWAVYNSDKFKACAAASPSVWFPKWIEYAQNNSPTASHIYLSLGNKEEKAKNIVSMGLINSRHKSIKSTCRIFGRLSETYKKNKDSYTSWTIPEFEKLLEPILKERKK